MPLNQSCSAEAFQENIRTEIRAGKSASQAAAIARRTLGDACKREGKPVPSSVEKAKKPRSREYLESVLSQARKLMPHWMFAVIHQAALPQSGGNAARNRRMSAAEKAWTENVPLGHMSNEVLSSMLRYSEKFHETCKRKGWSTDPTDCRAREYVSELKKRGHEEHGSFVDEIMKESNPTHLPEGTKIAKGFINGEPEGGMHAHGLDRRNGKTMQDGPHIHLFVLPGSGEVVLTIEDGSHAHAITEGGNTTEIDGGHSHMVELLSGDILETKLGGEHSHELMVETSGFDGLHRHTLKLEDGAEVESLSPGEFVARFVDPKNIVSWPMMSSRAVANALNEARRLRDEADMCEVDTDKPFRVPTTEVDIEIEINRALAEMAKGVDLPVRLEITGVDQNDNPVSETAELRDIEKCLELFDPPTIRMEVDKVRTDGNAAICKLKDFEADRAGDAEVLVADNVNLEPGDIVEISLDMVFKGFSRSIEPHTEDEARNLAKFAEAMESRLSHVDFCAGQDATLVFVSASPSRLEMARKEALIGADGELFAERYLAPMGLKKADVAAGFAIPVACDKPTDADIEMWRPRLLKELEAYPGAKIVALGRVAKQALGDLASFSMPHPAAVRRHGDSGEVDRKVKTICKALDIGVSVVETLNSSKDDPSHGDSGATLADSISELSRGQGLRVAVVKSIAEKQIIYGVVLDPYQVDLQGDWLPPAEIESTAHDFLEKSRVIGLRHKGVADAQIVESFIELYPTEKDREQALQNLPHKVYRRKFGSDTINSGAWIAGVKLSDELWSDHKSGKLDAFSIGGFSFKSQISTDAMPDVEFIDLLPSS